MKTSYVSVHHIYCYFLVLNRFITQGVYSMIKFKGNAVLYFTVFLYYKSCVDFYGSNIFFFVTNIASFFSVFWKFLSTKSNTRGWLPLIHLIIMLYLDCHIWYELSSDTCNVYFHLCRLWYNPICIKLFAYVLVNIWCFHH